MLWVFAIVLVVVIGGVAVVAAGAGGSLAPVYEDRPDVLVPADRFLGPEDLRGVRFSVGVRGYRMDEVDSLLSRLAEELAQRERQERAAGTAERTGAETLPGPHPAT